VTEPLQRRGDSVAAGNLLVDAVEPRITHTITLHDETLRDGEQTVGVRFTRAEKVELATGLIAAGLRSLNVGFPAVSEEEKETVRAIAQAADKSCLSALARATKADIEAVVACEIPTVALFIATSDVHLEHKLKMSEDEAYRRMVDQIKLAKSYGLRVRFAFEDASRTPLERTKRFAGGALEAGAAAVNLCDTCGVLTPAATTLLVRTIVEIAGKDGVAIHFHNDHGLALANSLAACAAGARFIQGTLLGLGERTGNTPLEQLAVALTTKYNVPLGIDLGKVVKLAHRVSEIVGFPIPKTAPVIGAHAVAHESGIHVHGIMSDTASYEPYPPRLVGRDHEVCYGKHSGLSNLKYLALRHDLSVPEETLTRVLERVKSLTEGGRSLSEEDVLGLVTEDAKANAPAAG
jgi:2-isopropylmalate synthase